MPVPGLVLRRRRPAPSWRSVLTVLALLSALVAPRASFASAEEEAARQLDFARSELDAGKPDRALKSAESALRLCPTCYDAMVVKALAYESLGDDLLAESLLLAYRELVGEEAADPQLEEHLRRIRATRGERHRTRAATPPVVDAGPMDVVASPVADLDPQPYRERVRDALGLGQCLVAQSAASELVSVAPAEAEGWRLAGDAARCSSDMRAAVLAYRRYVDRGGTEPSVLEMIDALASNLGVVSVHLTLAEGSAVPIVRLDTGEEHLSPFAASADELRFHDLPVASPLTVALAGRGLEALRWEVPGLAPGETHVIEAAPAWIGLGHVQISAHDPALCRTTLYTSDDLVVVGPGERAEVTAGAVIAQVDNDNGVLDVPLEVTPDDVVEFAPERHLPASLTVVGLPAGSEVRVFVETGSGEVVEQTTSLSPEVGEIDEESGVRLAPPHKFLSLRGGSGGVFVSHPVLGDAPASLVLETGAVNAATYPWEALAGVPKVSLAYLDWQEQVTAARRLQQRTSALAVVSSVLAAAGVGLLIGAAVEDGKITRASEDGLNAADEAALEEAWQGSQAAVRARAGLLVGGSVGVGLGGAGLVVTFATGGRARQAAAEVGPWNPAELE